MSCSVNYEDWAPGLLAYRVAYTSQNGCLHATHPPTSYDYEIMPARDLQYASWRMTQFPDLFNLESC